MIDPRQYRLNRAFVYAIAMLGVALYLCCATRAEAATGDEDTAAEAASYSAAASRAAPPVDLDLDQRIRPVSGHLFTKDGRHELSPSVGISVGDAFFSKYLLGLEYGVHLSDTWMIGLNAAYALSTPSGAVSRCSSEGQGCRLPTKEELSRAPGDFGMLAGIDVSWAPLYGKISVLAESVLHFDTYVLVGGGVIQSRIAPPEGGPVKETFAPEAHIAIGQRYVLSRHTALRFEIRDVLYQTELIGRTGVEKSIQNQLLFNVGLSFFLGGG